MVFNLIDEAPEKRSEETLTEKADCWGLGVLLFFVISGGKNPFRRQDYELTGEAIKNCEYGFDDSEVWGDKSEELKDLISKLLVRDPSKRLSAQEILEHPWIEKFRD